MGVDRLTEDSPFAVLTSAALESSEGFVLSRASPLEEASATLCEDVRSRLLANIVVIIIIVRARR